MYKVVEAQKLVTGDQFEIGNNLVEITNVEVTQNNNVRLLLKTVMPASKAHSLMTLLIYKKVLITVIANQKELSNVKV